MTRSIFIAGTDTGIGKTVVTAAMTAALRGSGLDCAPMKPVQTGCIRHGRGLAAPDLEFCLRMSGMNPGRRERELMCPARYRAPCSPHLAARIEKRPVRIGRICACHCALLEKHGMVIAESAGGLLVPLDGRVTMLDLIARMGSRVILVARPGLGTINHTLMSLRMLEHARISVLGVVINHAAPGGNRAIETDNVATITRLGRARILGNLPYNPKIAGRRCGRAEFAAWSAKHLPELVSIIKKGVDGN